MIRNPLPFSERFARQRHAKLLLIEELIPDDPGPHWSKTLDILMLSLLGGAQRTRQEYAALFKAADFSLVRVVDTAVFPFWRQCLSKRWNSTSGAMRLIQQESPMTTRFAAVYICGAVFCFGMYASWAASPAHTMVTPGELGWTDVASLPAGAKLAVIEGPLTEAVPFTFRLKLPANYKIPAHWHPAIEHVTVISGTFNMGVGDKLDTSSTKPLTSGSVAIMQPTTTHFAWTKDETIVQIHGTGPWVINYVNPADDPRKK